MGLAVLATLLLVTNPQAPQSAVSDEPKVGLFERAYWKDPKTGERFMGGYLINRSPIAYKQVTFRFKLVDESGAALTRLDVSLTDFENRSLASGGGLLPYSRAYFSTSIPIDKDAAALSDGYWIDIIGLTEDKSEPSKENPRSIFNFVLSQNSELSQALLKKNPEFCKAKDLSRGTNMAHLAAARNDEALLEILKEQKVDLGAKGVGGYLPMHVAAATDQDQSVRWLAKNGQSIEAAADKGKRPIHCAIEENSGESLDALIALGANVEAPIENGMRPLHLAAEYGFGRILLSLLNAKANLEASTPNGVRPLHCAVGGDHAKIAKLLLDKGADPNGSDPKEPWTPLHVAARAGSVECIQLLLARGANPLTKTKNNNTAAMLARKYGQEDAAEILEEAEKKVLAKGGK